ncbi:triacylglycerol lipase 2-like [Vigna umbellata]|uniref:triacylglycerol lipase 2-like n=1 Tax=Vigna umbellata TaxID=87088 RepID=UPI001F5ED3BC|nr:triacylglycerol lipase 2-like [Vigna umbellata]
MALQGSMTFAAFTFFLLLTTLPHEPHASSRGSFGRNINPPVSGLCSSSVIVHGYECQEHEVTTNDGYILSVQRIPEGRGGKGSGSRTSKQPVIIQHGVLVVSGNSVLCFQFLLSNSTAHNFHNMISVLNGQFLKEI